MFPVINIFERAGRVLNDADPLKGTRWTRASLLTTHQAFHLMRHQRLPSGLLTDHLRKCWADPLLYSNTDLMSIYCMAAITHLAVWLAHWSPWGVILSYSPLNPHS